MQCLEIWNGALPRLKAGYAAMLEQDQVAAGKTAAIGYCFGGAMVLHMARIGLELDAVVSFHGALGSFHPPTPGGGKRPRAGLSR